MFGKHRVDILLVVAMVIWCDGSWCLTYGECSGHDLSWSWCLIKCKKAWMLIGYLDDTLGLLLTSSRRPWYGLSWSWFLAKWYKTWVSYHMHTLS